ncbi:hypothetical protein OG936_33730 [Streptomyces sp. NBC_00846]|uniref:hypothetical protein n=1 Tax=Streptomyces sp. NBC_00846 TaxID=2975849 RepID=UPI00386D8A00|nr:hypothetical protein OG936_33730 [Streptomyces sp. NBC_00846]
MLTGFALAACGSEARLLDWADVIEVEQCLEFQLWRPKVNKDDAHGVPYGTFPGICPVRALRAWRQCLIDHGCQPPARSSSTSTATATSATGCSATARKSAPRPAA